MGNELVHIDLNVTNLPEAVKFYKLVFPHWKITKAENMPDYYFATDDAMPDDLAFGIGLADKVEKGSIVLYINVEDLLPAMKRVTDAGGKILLEKTSLGGNHGFISRFEDPFGNIIGMWSAT